MPGMRLERTDLPALLPCGGELAASSGSGVAGWQGSRETLPAVPQSGACDIYEQAVGEAIPDGGEVAGVG
jgi:hypothetical protein